MAEECSFLINSRGVIFDLDGTLIDSVPSHIKSWIVSFERVMNKVVEPEVIDRLIGLSGVDIVRRLFGFEGLRKYREIRWIKDRVFLNDIRYGGVQLYPGALRLLKELRRVGKLIGIATSTPTYLTIHILEYFGILKYIDRVVCGDDVSKGKPNPEIFLKCISMLGIPPGKAIVVGDTLYDVIPALTIKASAVLVNNTSPQPPGGNASSLHTFSDLCSLLTCMRRSLHRD